MKNEKALEELLLVEINPTEIEKDLNHMGIDIRNKDNGFITFKEVVKKLSNNLESNKVYRKQQLMNEKKRLEKEYFVKVKMPIDISTLKIQTGDRVNLMVYKTIYGEFEISGIDNYSITYKVDNDTADKFTKMIEEGLYDNRIYSVEYR